MGLKLSSVATVAPVAPVKLPPLAPVLDPDTGQPAVITVAGVKLAVVARGADAGRDTWQLARYRAARAQSADYAPAIPASGNLPAVPAKGRPAREEGWSATSRVQDIARAIAGKLLT